MASRVFRVSAIKRPAMMVRSRPLSDLSALATRPRRNRSVLAPAAVSSGLSRFVGQPVAPFGRMAGAHALVEGPVLLPPRGGPAPPPPSAARRISGRPAATHPRSWRRRRPGNPPSCGAGGRTWPAAPPLCRPAPATRSARHGPGSPRAPTSGRRSRVGRRPPDRISGWRAAGRSIPPAPDRSSARRSAGISLQC